MFHTIFLSSPHDGQPTFNALTGWASSINISISLYTKRTTAIPKRYSCYGLLNGKALFRCLAQNAPVNDFYCVNAIPLLYICRKNWNPLPPPARVFIVTDELSARLVIYSSGPYSPVVGLLQIKGLAVVMPLFYQRQCPGVLYYIEGL